MNKKILFSTLILVSFLPLLSPAAPGVLKTSEMTEPLMISDSIFKTRHKQSCGLTVISSEKNIVLVATDPSQRKMSFTISPEMREFLIQRLTFRSSNSTTRGERFPEENKLTDDRGEMLFWMRKGTDKSEPDYLVYLEANNLKSEMERAALAGENQHSRVEIAFKYELTAGQVSLVPYKFYIGDAIFGYCVFGDFKKAN